MHSWVQFLSTAEASPGHPGAAQQLVAERQHPGNKLWQTQYQFCIICIISLIINTISIISVISKTFYIQFLSLSAFSSFSFPLVGGWGLTESICHSVYWRPALNSEFCLQNRKNALLF